MRHVVAAVDSAGFRLLNPVQMTQIFRIIQDAVNSFHAADQNFNPNWF
jgi:hypothetical protein